MLRNSDDLREGFYWFCPAETPFYPGLHNLGSRDWTSDERIPWPALGEWEGERSWYRGDPPARRPLSVLVGSPDCIQYGDDPNLPVVPDKSAFCGEILPGPCYGAEESVFAKTNVADCVFAKNSADIIAAAYSDLVVAEGLVSVLLGPTAVVTSFPQPSPLIPAGVIAVIGDTAVLWLTGTTNFEQLACQIFYAGFGPINQGLYSTSGLYEAAAFAIADQLVAAGAGSATRTVLVGHSYGGALCMVLAAKMHIADPDRTVEILTLGAPAAGDQRLVDLVRIFYQVHYADERDPVPYLPPRGVTFAALVPFLGPVLSLIWPTFERYPVVKTITEDGLFVDQPVDELPTDLITIASLAIAAAEAVPAFKNHRVDWYAYWLCNACKCVPRPCVPPDDPGVGFNLELDALAYTFLSAPGVLTIPATDLLPIAFFPDGKASTWRANLAGIATATITAAQDGLGNYTSFAVFTEPDPVNPLWLCEWDFTAVEMLAGIDLSTFPDVFVAPNVGDGVTSLGFLKIIPTLG